MLAEAALRRSGLAGFCVSIDSDFPIGAGLGGSSSAGVALAASIACARHEKCDTTDLALRSRQVEVEELGVSGGFQDHYAAAFGGALGLTFSDVNYVEVLAISDDTIDDIEHCHTLIYTGESRSSGETILGVMSDYRNRVPRVLQALDHMAKLARSMRDALSAGDTRTLALLIDEHWQYQRTLHPRITTDRIDSIESAVRKAGAFAFKALGASGGGCVLACSSREDASRVRAVAATLGQVLSWKVARTGVCVTMQSGTSIT